MLKKSGLNIRVKGLVQGVGFRPFIYRIAVRNKLYGWVDNRNDGVYIEVEGKSNDLDNFLKGIRKDAPQASKIISIDSRKKSVSGFKDFKILLSKNTSNEITDISPDIAICNDCLEDMKTQKNRIDYPFTNCTNCGPRFTIIKDLPYDREKTTMNSFIMCNDCEKEYKNVLDRRFHAQPVACSNCGPEYELIYKNRKVRGFNKIIKITSKILEEGKIVSIKGLGGFHIACDANNEATVKRLRELKNRDGKPFAVMFSNINKLKEHTITDKISEERVLSWQRPILLLPTKKKLADSVSVGFKTIGAMLPYMPFHYLLFEKLNLSSIVLTSGNLSEEPIVIDNKTAEYELSKISDAVLTYNRDIYNRTDDSVAIVINNKERIIRRSRAYTPSPVNLDFNTDGIFAAGAELVNCFCIGKGKQAILSQHIGDLKNIETLEFYTQIIYQFNKLFRTETELIVCDLHPDYLSGKYALEQKQPIMMVQHHHAHIASCMAEHNLDEKVIGIAFDGVGLGDDDKIWGGEFFLCDLEDYERINHFEYIPMPGGDSATKNPWRMAVSYLYSFFGDDLKKYKLGFLDNIDKSELELIISIIKKNINCPLTSSAGRLFDAVSALTGLCTHSSFHAEAPMRLEDAIDQNIDEAYNFDINNSISFKKTFTEIIYDIEKNISSSIISAKFHNTIISIIFAIVFKASKKYNINKVVLSGGSFQNRYILERTEKLLTENGFIVYSHSKIPSNDGGIALGQLAIAAKRRYSDKKNI